METPIIYRTIETTDYNQICPYCKSKYAVLYKEVVQKRFGLRTSTAAYCSNCKMRIDIVLDKLVYR